MDSKLWKAMIARRRCISRRTRSRSKRRNEKKMENKKKKQKKKYIFLNRLENDKCHILIS